MNLDIDSIKYRNRVWYLKTYESLVKKAMIRGLDRTKLDYYTEKHHILPKCQGGKDEDSNYVLLTAREHIIAHMLLAKMWPDNSKLSFAVSRMLVTKEPDKENKDYETIKSRYDATKKFSTRFLADLKENFANAIRKTNTGRRKSPETLEKLKKSLKEFNNKNPDFWKGRKVHTEEHKQELSNRWKGEKNPNYGGISEEHRRNLSLSHFGTSPNQKKVIHEETGKIFRSIADAARFAKVPESTLKYWIKNKPEKGYSLYLS